MVELNERVRDVNSPEPPTIDEVIDHGGNVEDVEEEYEDDAMFEFITDNRTTKAGGIISA